jgi:hypothetical protein
MIAKIIEIKREIKNQDIKIFLDNIIDHDIKITKEKLKQQSRDRK